MNKEALIRAGINYDEGTERFGGQPKLYEKYLAKFFDEPLMDNLERQLSKGDINGAFRTAHDLKGAAGNLSLNEYYDKLCNLTELLRSGEPIENCIGAITPVRDFYNKAKQAVKEELL